MSAAACPAALIITLAQPAFAAGGHFLVDDADITPAGDCQLESWFQRASSGTHDRVDQPSAEHAWVAQSMCSTRNFWEVATPVEYNTSDNELAAYGLEVKTMMPIQLLEGNLAFSAGIMRDHQESEFEGGFINIPYSRALNERFKMHFNLGTEYNQADSEWSPTWGAATAFRLHDRIDLISEAAGVGSDSPSAALGLRSQLSSAVEFDASFGRDFEVRSNIFSIGLNMAF